MNAPSQTLIWNPEIEWSELRSLSPFSLYACLRTFLVCVSVRVWPWNNAKTVGRENCLRNSGTTHHQNANVILISLFYLDASPITLLSAWNIIIEFCFRITDYVMQIQFRSTTGTNNQISVFVCSSEPVFVLQKKSRLSRVALGYFEVRWHLTTNCLIHPKVSERAYQNLWLKGAICPSASVVTAYMKPLT